MTTLVMKRFLAKTVIDGNGCWIWAGSMARDGYGRAALSGKWVSAHRLAHELFNGPIPDGFEIDHQCRTRACVNPQHLEPVTHLENMRRRYVLYTHCQNGHEFDEANTYIKPSGHRDCRKCGRERQQRHKSRKLTGAEKAA